MSKPSAVLAEHWTTLDGVEVFYRESPGPADGSVMVHLHGFGMSGAYLVPTAERLAGEFHTFVPDLPGFGRSGNSVQPLDVTDLAHAAAAFLDDRDIASATLVGNSMGCAVITEFAYLYPDRLDRAVLVAPAGGLHNQPLHRAMRQLVTDGVREPPKLVPVAVPDYLRFGVPSTLRLFRALTKYPSLDRLLAMQVPTMAVIGNRDPLMPGPERLKEVAGQTSNHALLVIIEGAAHAELQPPGRAGQRHPPLHGRPARRRRPGRPGCRAHVRAPPRNPDAADLPRLAPVPVRVPYHVVIATGSGTGLGITPRQMREHSCSRSNSGVSSGS